MNENDTVQWNELREVWNRLDRRVGSNLAELQSMTRALVADRARTLAQRAALPPLLDLTVAVVALLCVGVGFSQDGSSTFHACVWGAAGILFVLAASALVQILTLTSLDPAAPVLVTQRRLGWARKVRVLEWQWVLLLSPLLWTPFLVVAVELPLKLLSHGETGNLFSASYVLVSLAIGAAISGILWLCSRWLGRRLGEGPFLRGFLEDLAGRRLTAARSFLERIDEYASEGQGDPGDVGGRMR